MPEKFRNAVLVLGLLALAVGGFWAARLWQSGQAGYRRVAGPADCDLGAGACQWQLDGRVLEFSIEPRTIPLMKPLRLVVATRGIEPDRVVVDIRGLNMAMGLNRTALTRGADGIWRGETILPVCSQRRMEWEAAVRLDLDRPLEVPFVFGTVRR